MNENQKQVNRRVVLIQITYKQFQS
jgi:hypothetical protein